MKIRHILDNTIEETKQNKTKRPKKNPNQPTRKKEIKKHNKTPPVVYIFL